MTIIIILLGTLILLAVINIWLAFKNKGNDGTDILTKLAKIDSDIARIDPLIRDEFGRNRTEMQNAFKENREELGNSVKLLGDTLSKTVTDLSNAQKNQFESYYNRLKEIRETVEKKLSNIQEDNNKKLEEMRKTVDEKLQESVEKRFNESFKLINERLEAVHKGLGEMQNLATGVGDLKKVLTNVKTRGTFGEVQLGTILDQFLSPEQYIKNDHPDEDNERRVVEYSIKLPGKEANEPILLPIDSKFPVEDYQRLIDAYDNQPELVENYSNQLGKTLEKCAKDIYEKYIKPPRTTDFALLFVPTEGLYAEIIRRPGFIETIQNKYRVIVVGPTNLVALLNSLQMGFRTLAIQKRSSEVWELLGAVKTEFGKFGDVLEKTQKKLESTITEISNAGKRSRAIERKLKTVEALPEEKSVKLIGETAEIEPEDDFLEYNENE
jgi:DNA recombination protein RmuC